MSPVLVIFGLLGIGMVLVITGTIAKNRWGINLDPVSCPRCNTPFPQIRQPQNIRQTLWGGGTCTKCGADVDKWGREVTVQRHSNPAGGVKPKDQMRRALKRKLLSFTAGSFFCLTLLSDWLGIRPSVGQMVWKAWPSTHHGRCGSHRRRRTRLSQALPPAVFPHPGRSPSVGLTHCFDEAEVLGFTYISPSRCVSCNYRRNVQWDTRHDVLHLRK
jgi:hypothetical protein